MANLVAPVAKLEPVEERIIEFKGLNRKHVVQDGEMSDMWNLTSDNYPLLTPRKARGSMRIPAGAIRPYQIMAKFDKIAMIASTDNGIGFYYDGRRINQVTGLSESTRMVSINTKICFFPEKTYLEVSPQGVPGTYGSLEASVDVAAIAVTLSNEDARLTLSAGHGFKYDDALNIHISSYTPSGGTLTQTSFDISCIIEKIVDTNTLVLPRETFIEMTGQGVTNFTFTGTISRTMPNLDHVIEWDNRLWGCSNADNTVYACKLGDPTNWQYYQGTGLDSYYAQQGTDGLWTGIALYSGHLICFKQNSMCRVYGTAPSNYQVTNAEVYGVEAGSRQSVVTINDTVFYKGKPGIMAYSGGVPVCISDNFNTEFRNVVAGTEKRKYYASIQNKTGGYELMVYDIEKGIWHKEDSTRFRGCATIGDSLYYIEVNDTADNCSSELLCSEWLTIGGEAVDARIWIINPTVPEEDAKTMRWSAVFGPFDEWLEERKIYSKLALRIFSISEEDNILSDENDEHIQTELGFEFQMPQKVDVYISINEGEWELVESYEPPSTGGEYIPIIPRRCDRYSVKLEGEGLCEIKTLTRRVRRGSFGRL